ncbi:MAG: hypothetical protein ACLUMO_09065 [Lachnospiraceae bacterium]
MKVRSSVKPIWEKGIIKRNKVSELSVKTQTQTCRITIFEKRDL